MTLALRSILPTGLFSKQSQRVGRYELLLQRHGGLRSDVWLAIDADAEGFEKVVSLQHYVPHEPGPALYNLETELDLARELNHENIARTLEIGFESGRHFIVKEHLEGITLEALLRCQLVAGAELSVPALVHILLGVFSAVEHAARVSRSVGAKVLSRQPVELGDVFLTHQGQVKVLGFKMPLSAVNSSSSDSGAAAAASVVALLSSHLTQELRDLLAPGSSEKVRPCDELAQLREALEAHPSTTSGAGRRALVALLEGSPSSVRIEPRARLEAAFDAAARGGRLRARPLGLGTDELGPQSGLRRIELPQAVAAHSVAPELEQKSRTQQALLVVCACLVAAITSFLVTH
jgi:hypothetical protein